MGMRKSLVGEAGRAAPYASDTSGYVGESYSFVAAAGASRTYRRAYPAANDLVGIYEDVGTRLNGASSVHSFRFSTSESDGAAISAIRTPPGVIRSNGTSSRRSPPRRGTTVKLSRACGKPVPPHMQR